MTICKYTGSNVLQGIGHMSNHRIRVSFLMDTSKEHVNAAYEKIMSFFSGAITDRWTIFLLDGFDEKEIIALKEYGLTGLFDRRITGISYINDYIQRAEILYSRTDSFSY